MHVTERVAERIRGEGGGGPQHLRGRCVCGECRCEGVRGIRRRDLSTPSTILTSSSLVTGHPAASRRSSRRPQESSCDLGQDGE
jgi:hypothetical protein